MRSTISAPTLAALAGSLTAPAYLVSIGWSTPSYLTSGASLTWGGHDWVSANVRVSGFSWSSREMLSGSLSLGNADQGFSVMALGEGTANIPVVIYLYDQTAVGSGDPVLIFNGIGGSCTLTYDRVDIEIRTNTVLTPRVRMTSAYGFNFLVPQCYTVNWGNEKYVFKGRK